MHLLPIELDALAVIGVLITLAYLGSKGVQRFGIPQVVGFILVGLILGTSFLNFAAGAGPRIRVHHRDRPGTDRL